MHPDTCWMIYRAETIVRHQQFQQHQQLLAYPRLHHHVAVWSGHHLLHCAHWLLRYGQQSEQWTLGMNGVGRGARN